MNKVILFPREDGGVSIVHPCDCGISVEEIARKDVPAGVPFLIVDTADLPADRTYVDAWTADFSEPHGVGIGTEAWLAERGHQ